ncbi:hypothetical protein F4823DRAFT_562787 [Ustulina deusta]|nr:hypothetical protein F4823DRAFT_562787 [Ustulina deusta]
MAFSDFLDQRVYNGPKRVLPVIVGAVIPIIGPNASIPSAPKGVIKYATSPSSVTPARCSQARSSTGRMYRPLTSRFVPAHRLREVVERDADEVLESRPPGAEIPPAARLVARCISRRSAEKHVPDHARRQPLRRRLRPEQVLLRARAHCGVRPRRTPLYTGPRCTPACARRVNCSGCATRRRLRRSPDLLSPPRLAEHEDPFPRSGRRTGGCIDWPRPEDPGAMLERAEASPCSHLMHAAGSFESRSFVRACREISGWVPPASSIDQSTAPSLSATTTASPHSTLWALNSLADYRPLAPPVPCLDAGAASRTAARRLSLSSGRRRHS